MSTVIGFECSGGTVVAGDRLAVRGGRVVGRDRPHVFDFAGDESACGAAAVGEGLDTFERRVDADLRAYRIEYGEPTLDTVARIITAIAEATGVDAIVVARDEEGEAHVRTVDRDGSVLGEAFAARGTGRDLALGRLEAADRDVAVEEAASLARDVLETVAERDPQTGEDIDVYCLSDDSA